MPAPSSSTARLERLPSVPRYREIAASPALAPWVACYWSIHGAEVAPAVNRVLPDGCLDLIAGLTDERAVVVGAMRSAAVVPLTGRVDLFGIRFRPGAALPFLDVPLDELTDRQISVETFWGSSDADEFAGATLSAGVESRVTIVERLLQRRLRRCRQDDGEAVLAARAMAMLRRTATGQNVHRVSRELGVGERRLERIFDRRVGLTPKFFERVFRFRRALRIIGSTPARQSPAWARIAVAAGYADQPHFIREFRALAGVTPTEYLAEGGRVGFVQYDDEITI